MSKREPYQVAGAIRASLRLIADNYDEALTGTAPRDDSDAKPKRMEAPVPVSAHILDVRRDTVHDLAFYALFILEQVNDGTISGHVDGGNVAALCRFVDTWAQHLAEQHPADAGQCERDMGKHGRRLQAIVKGEYTKRFRLPHGLDRCPQLEWRDEEMVRCTGTLQAFFKQSDDQLPPYVGCEANAEHKWAPHEWISLGRKLIA